MGRGKGNRVEPQERGTPPPCTARLTSPPHRGLAPLPAQQELLSDPEPLAETPPRTPGRAGRGHPRPPRRALSRSGCGCKRSHRPRQRHPSAHAEPAGQLESEDGILATALLGRGTGWGPRGEGRTPQGPGHRAPGTEPCADPVGLCNGRGPTSRPSPGPAGHPPSDPQGRVVQQDTDNVEQAGQQLQGEAEQPDPQACGGRDGGQGSRTGRGPSPHSALCTWASAPAAPPAPTG